jgi:hypothetical protein
MSEAAEENPLEEIKEKINEVIELLNQPNLPVAVHDEDVEAGESGSPKE